MLAALRAVVPGPEGDFARWAACIAAVAEIVLRRADLCVGDARWRVTEVEGYVSAPGHPDPFTHADVAQNSLGRWYFHRTGGTHRGGTFKGVDLTFGGDGVCAGMLLRAAVTDRGERVDGPSLLVDAMLRATGHGTVSSLARACDEGAHDALSLVLRDSPRGDAVYAGPRVGLSLRRAVSAERVFFLPRPYRFVVDPRGARKGRLHLALGMHREGMPADAIAGVMGASLAQVRAWIDAYAQGRGARVTALREAQDGEALCALLGACDAAFTRREEC